MVFFLNIRQFLTWKVFEHTEGIKKRIKNAAKLLMFTDVYRLFILCMRIHAPPIISHSIIVYCLRTYS
jgi:hypothetical protein